MLFSHEMRGVERAMDALSMRFQATAANLANVHTPGYQRQTVDFEDSLEEVLAMSVTPIDPERSMDAEPPDDSVFLNMWQPIRRTEEHKTQRIDGNGVSLEHEMIDATRTAGRYNTLAAWIAAEYRNLKFVVDAR